MEFQKNGGEVDLDAIVKELDAVDKSTNGDAEKNLQKKPAIPETKKRTKKLERRNSKEAALGVSGVSLKLFPAKPVL